MLSALLLCVEYCGVRGEGDEGGGRDWRRAVKRVWRASSAIQNTIEGEQVFRDISCLKMLSTDLLLLEYIEVVGRGPASLGVGNCGPASAYHTDIMICDQFCEFRSLDLQ